MDKKLLIVNRLGLNEANFETSLAFDLIDTNGDLVTERA